LEQLFTFRGTQISTHDNLAGDAGLALLDEAAPDVLVSVGCPEILPPGHLAIPRLTALNLHNGRLPEYRGLIATFWELMEGEAWGCVTLHVMQPEVDRGPILAQAEVPLAGQRSLLPLLREKKRVGGQLLAQALSDPSTALGKAVPPPGPGRYWDWPSARQVLTLAWRLRFGHPKQP
jgi:methionyl-tRNA formyltransferase